VHEARFWIILKKRFPCLQGFSLENVAYHCCYFKENLHFKQKKTSFNKSRKEKSFFLETFSIPHAKFNFLLPKVEAIFSEKGCLPLNFIETPSNNFALK
jgi:hypothetical protein